MLPEMELYNIYDYIYVPFWKTTYGVVTMALFCSIVLASIVAIFIFWKIKHRKQMSPEQVALSEIEGLLSRVCCSREDFKILYFDLTGIVKLYLYDRYNIKILDKTDCEVISLLRSGKYRKEIVDIMRKILLGAQGVRFANESVLQVQVMRDLKLAKRLVVFGSKNGCAR